MRIDSAMIRAQFDAVLAATVTRESVSDWARRLREADDREELLITPDCERQRLWKAILFLEGVDMKDAPDSYLHNDEDISRERP
jgi:hypothetical protein